LEIGEASPARVASRTWRVAFACAMLLVIRLVYVNVVTYQKTVSNVSKYAAALESGLAAEQRGDWESARAGYGSAQNIALHPPEKYGIPVPFPSVYGPEYGRGRLSRARYYEAAFRAADLDFIFLRLPGRGGPPGMPDEVADFGVARCLWNLGRTEEALKRLEDNTLQRYWPEFMHALGEMHWQRGDCDKAADDWRKAGRMNRERKPFPPLEYPFDVPPSLDEIRQGLDAEVKSLAGSAKPADIARRIALLLRLDRREEAVNALKAAPADAPELAMFRAALNVQ
jgi:tetratricopeptide (TPR) repeat protein